VSSAFAMEQIKNHALPLDFAIERPEQLKAAAGRA
jgi:hypothetical protein